jgi:hypothetical protein
MARSCPADLHLRVASQSLPPSMIDVAPSQASTVTAGGVTAPLAKGSPRRSAGLTRSKSWSQALSIRENRYAPAKSVALWQRGSKLMLGSSSWNPSRQVRALIAVGLFIIRAVLVWAAFAGPSTPDLALAPVPNGDGCRRRLPVRPRPAANDLRKERITFGTRSRGWFCRRLSQWPCRLPKLGVRSRLVDLGLGRDGAMEVPEPGPRGLGL